MENTRDIDKLRQYIGGNVNTLETEPIFTNNNNEVKIRESAGVKTIYTLLKTGDILVQNIAISGTNVDISTQTIDNSTAWDSI